MKELHFCKKYHGFIPQIFIFTTQYYNKKRQLKGDCAMNIIWYAVGIMLFLIVFGLIWFITNGFIGTALPEFRITPAVSILAIPAGGSKHMNLKQRKGFTLTMTEYVGIIIGILITIMICLQMFGLLDSKAIAQTFVNLRNPIG
jgi:hypothetical protein